MLGGNHRESLYGEHYEGTDATRMIRDRREKLIDYAAGNGISLSPLR